MKHRMSRLQRAKQFMPFAALRGFEALLAAVAKPKENRAELSEDQIDELNTVLQSVRCGEWVRIVYYNKRKYTELIGAVDMISEQLQILSVQGTVIPVSYTHLRAHETGRNLVCRLLLEKKKTKNTKEAKMI